MLTTNDHFNLEDYGFKNSPESCSSNSYFTDYTDLPSDEDFLQQLSADLDIPLLLNQGEDELSLLNSFFDKSPEEIMSEIVLNESQTRLQAEVKLEPEIHSSSSCSSLSPVQSPKSLTYFELKDELKDEPVSPSSVISTSSDDAKILISPKVVPIQPRAYIQPRKKVVLFKNTANSSILSPPPAKVVVLENVTTVPFTKVTQIAPTTTPVTISSPLILKSSISSNVATFDAKILKRQQRKIKNRESACLSRKKKKDYVTSLENQVKELSNENLKLKNENQELIGRLMRYECGKSITSITSKTSTVKTNVVLCMFLLSMAFHFDFMRGPLFSRNHDSLISGNLPHIDNHPGRNLLWMQEDVPSGNNSNLLSFSMCPAAINQTESARLALELERWIGKPKSLVKANVTTKTNPSKIIRRRKVRKYQAPFIAYSADYTEKLPVRNNEIQVFTPTPEQLYSDFFEAINRQDDTFYVVSFSDHHMLLPALHHNKTRRPKMSLIMPSMLPSENTTQPSFMPLMQIDCEVLDTRLIHVKYRTIPKHLRKQGNSTFGAEGMTKSNEAASNYTNSKPYKPYFIKRKDVTKRGYL